MSTVERVDSGDGIVTLILDREHGNAINEALVSDLLSAIVTLEQDSDIRVVRLAAKGKLFCPGLDLQELVELDRPAMTHFLRHFNALIMALFAFPKPMLALMHGHAVAGGCVLALTADWRILAEGAKVGLNEVKVGVPFPFGVSMILRDAIPSAELTRVALLGDNLSGDDALRAGLAHELAPASEFRRICDERAAAFAERDPYAVRMTKRYLRSATVERIRAQEGQFVDEFLDGWFAPSTRERIEGLVAGLKARQG